MATVFLAASIALATSAHAASNDAGSLGLGFTTGGGLTGKYWLSREQAVDFGASLGINFAPAFSFPLGVRGGFLLHQYDWFTLDSGEMPVYFGGGLELNPVFASPVLFGIALYGAVGVDYLLKNAPVDFFLEVNPRIAIPDFSPFAMGLNFGGTLGVRYYFGQNEAAVDGPRDEQPAAAETPAEPAPEPKAEPKATEAPAKGKSKKK